MNFRTRFLVPLFCLSQIVTVMAQDQVKLFKFVSPKDEVVVGITAEELKKFGTGAVTVFHPLLYSH